MDIQLFTVSSSSQKFTFIFRWCWNDYFIDYPYNGVLYNIKNDTFKENFNGLEKCFIIKMQKASFKTAHVE